MSDNIEEWLSASVSPSTPVTLWRKLVDKLATARPGPRSIAVKFNYKNQATARAIIIDIDIYSLHRNLLCIVMGVNNLTG